MIGIKLAIWVVVILGFVAWNYYVIKVKKQRPFYLVDNILKGIAFVVYGALIWDTQYEMRTVWIAVYCATSYWLLFDVIMGMMLHGDPLYVGAGSGWIDQFGTKYTVAYWILKAVALVLLIQSIIKISHG